LDKFIKLYPDYQLEDELLAEEGSDVMWGRHYQRRTQVQKDTSGVVKP
jgi:hypothetical protein